MIRNSRPWTFATGLTGLVTMIGGIPAVAQTASMGVSTPQPLAPDRVARVLPDGSLGPWRDFVAAQTQSSGEPFAAVWDSYELDPRNYGRRQNVPSEYYDVPPGSGQYCLGQGAGGRLFWCDPEQPGCRNLPSCVSATGGQVADNAPDRVLIASFLWGVRGNGQRLQAEFQFFDTFDGTDCLDPGSNMVGGFVASFIPPPPGQYFSTLDLTVNGLDFDTPRTGRIGIRVIMWEDRQQGIHSDQAWPLVWPTKTEWSDVMGLDDENGFSDGHGNDDCELNENAPDECVQGEPACPNGDGPVGPAVLLLGEGEFGNCQYRLKKDAKAKKRCGSCPKKGDVFDTADECVDKFDCRVKLSIKQIDCPDGGAGFCKKIKGKRLDCRR